MFRYSSSASLELSFTSPRGSCQSSPRMSTRQVHSYKEMVEKGDWIWSEHAPLLGKIKAVLADEWKEELSQW